MPYLTGEWGRRDRNRERGERREEEPDITSDFPPIPIGESEPNEGLKVIGPFFSNSNSGSTDMLKNYLASDQVTHSTNPPSRVRVKS